MIKVRRSQIGVGLFEILMVLVLISAVILLSIRQYSMYRNQANIMALQNNVAQIFEAMTNYYRANCNQTTFTSLTFYTIPIPMSTLIGKGYMESLPTNPLVNESAEYPYFAQFNRTNGVMTLPTSWSSTSTTIAYADIWQIQVAVALKNIPQYLFELQPQVEMLGADCWTGISAYDPIIYGMGGCGNNEAPLYAVYFRMPTTTRIGLSPYWQTMPSAIRFSQQYSQTPLSILLDPVQSERSFQYIYCGS